MCRKRVLSNKISYCVSELSFCAFSFVHYTQRPVQKHLQNKMADPEASVHTVKSRLCYHFEGYPRNENCSQRCSRRIMLLRSLIKILLTKYSSKCYWGWMEISQCNWYPAFGMTTVQVYTGMVSIKYRDTTTYRYTAHPYLKGMIFPGLALYTALHTQGSAII